MCSVVQFSIGMIAAVGASPRWASTAWKKRELKKLSMFSYSSCSRSRASSPVLIAGSSSPSTSEPRTYVIWGALHAANNAAAPVTISRSRRRMVPRSVV